MFRAALLTISTSLTILSTSQAAPGVMVVGGEADRVQVFDGNAASEFSIASLAPGQVTVALHNLAFDPSSSHLFLLTNGGLFRGEATAAQFPNTNLVGAFHGHEVLDISPSGIIAVGGEADRVQVFSGNTASEFSIASLAPGQVTVALHDLAFDPSSSDLFVLTNGGLFRGQAATGQFLNTNTLSPFHGHEVLGISPSGIIAVGGEADRVQVFSGNTASEFSIASLAPGQVTVALHDLSFDPSSSDLFVLTNGGLFRGQAATGQFLNTNLVSAFHGHEVLAILVPEPSSWLASFLFVSVAAAAAIRHRVAGSRNGNDLRRSIVCRSPATGLPRAKV
jgi:hypothetical protein